MKGYCTENEQDIKPDDLAHLINFILKSIVVYEQKVYPDDEDYALKCVIGALPNTFLHVLASTVLNKWKSEDDARKIITNIVNSLESEFNQVLNNYKLMNEEEAKK